MSHNLTFFRNLFKMLDLLVNLFILIHGSNFSKIGQPNQYSLRSELFDISFWPFDLLWCIFFIKLVKLFKIHGKIKYFTSAFDIWPWSHRYAICFNQLLIIIIMVQVLAILVKLFKDYCKMKYLICDYNLWPLGQSC